MSLLPQLTSVIFALLVVVGVPILSFLTMRDPKICFLPRPVLYASAVVSQWTLVTLAAAVAAEKHMHPRDLGLHPVSPAPFSWWVVFLITVTALGTALLMLLEAVRLWPRESELLYRLLPRTRREKLWAVLVVAPTAAICEEFLYRGYLLNELAGWAHSVTAGWIFSSVAFGLAHVYQRWHGIIRAALLGALLAYPVVRAGSLYPSMCAHFIIDAAAFGWLGATLMRDEEHNRLEAAQMMISGPPGSDDTKEES